MVSRQLNDADTLGERGRINDRITSLLKSIEHHRNQLPKLRAAETRSKAVGSFVESPQNDLAATIRIIEDNQRDLAKFQAELSNIGKKVTTQTNDQVRVRFSDGSEATMSRRSAEQLAQSEEITILPVSTTTPSGGGKTNVLQPEIIGDTSAGLDQVGNTPVPTYNSILKALSAGAITPEQAQEQIAKLAGWTTEGAKIVVDRVMAGQDPLFSAPTGQKREDPTPEVPTVRPEHLPFFDPEDLFQQLERKSLEDERLSIGRRGIFDVLSRSALDRPLSPLAENALGRQFGVLNTSFELDPSRFGSDIEPTFESFLRNRQSGILGPQGLRARGNEIFDLLRQPAGELNLTETARIENFRDPFQGLGLALQPLQFAAP